MPTLPVHNGIRGLVFSPVLQRSPNRQSLFDEPGSQGCSGEPRDVGFERLERGNVPFSPLQW
jgi:hypothetical protein